MKVLIVDDEPLGRMRLRRLLTGLPDISVAGEADNGQQALAAVDSLQPDVVLMDIRMPGLDGLSAARELAERPLAPAVIFCSAYDEYAIEAFEANAIGYLLKPVNQDKLLQALAKAQRLSRPQLASFSEGVAQAGGARSQLAAKSRRGIELLPFAQARYFIADHKYVTVFHTGGELLLDDTLKELEDEFGARLLRVHRNALVVLEHIQGLERIELGQYRVKLHNILHGPVVSRRHLPDVRKLLEQL
ncbi:MAG: LytTR family DNA-binding domain-containing protein [Spongiibacteraceae bacterium]